MDNAARQFPKTSLPKAPETTPEAKSDSVLFCPHSKLQFRRLGFEHIDTMLRIRLWHTLKFGRRDSLRQVPGICVFHYYRSKRKPPQVHAFCSV